MRRVSIRRVLCPSDFSVLADRALRLTSGLAGALSAEVRAVHVVPRHGAAFRHRGAGTSPLAYLPVDMAGLQAELDRSLEPIQERGIFASAAVLEGEVDGQIVEEACAFRADLIVMGTRGLSGRQGWGVGSVTESVLVRSPCPILAVPSAREWPERIERILAPIDFSDASLVPLDYAFTLARALGAALVPLHVLDYFSAEAGTGEEDWSVPELQTDFSESARQRLARLLPASLGLVPPPTPLVVAGRPAQAIVRVAAEQAADLVVLGFEARRTIARTLIAGTVSHVLRSAPCSVLAVPVG